MSIDYQKLYKQRSSEMASQKPFAIKSYQSSSYFSKPEGNNSSDSTTNSSLPTTPHIFHVLANPSPPNDNGYDSDSSDEGRKFPPPAKLGLRVLNPDKDDSVIGTPSPVHQTVVVDKRNILENTKNIPTLVSPPPPLKDDPPPPPSETEWKVFKQQQQQQIRKPDLPPHQELLAINSGNLYRRESKTLADAAYATNQIKGIDSTPNEVIPLPLSPVPSVKETNSEYAPPTSPSFTSQNHKPSTIGSFANPITTTSKYAKVSYHLTNDPTAIKKYREMAEKTNDTTTQLMFAKYLLETANAFHSTTSSPQQAAVVVGSMWGIGSTTNKPQRPEPYLVVPPPDHNTTSSSVSSAGSNNGKSLVEATSMTNTYAINYQQQQSLMNVTMKQRATLNNNQRIAASTTNESNDHKRKLLEQEGIKWIVRLAKQNVGEACYMQASWMDKQLYGFKPNKNKSFALHQIAAKSNIPESVYAVAKYFEEERGLDESKIVKLYQSASSAGYVNAIYRLALLTIHGKLGLRQSLTDGLSLMYRACTLSSEECNTPPYTFALMLTNEYEEADFPSAILEPYGGKEAAILYYERAARLNNDHAQAKLGSIYEHGLYGESMNFARAFDFYEQAAMNGNDKAMLGLCRLNNRGSHGPGDKNEAMRLENDVSGWLAATPVNEDIAFSWCEKAAKAGNVDALSMLGWFYESGFGVPRDFGLAEKYYQLAVDQGDTGAKSRLMNTNVSITKKQHESIAAADKGYSSSLTKMRTSRSRSINKKDSSCRCM